MPARLARVAVVRAMTLPVILDLYRAPGEAKQIGQEPIRQALQEFRPG